MIIKLLSHMPIWFYVRFVRPILFLFDPEDMHHFTIWMLKDKENG